MRRAWAICLLLGAAQAQVLSQDAQVGWPAGTLPFGQLDWAVPLPGGSQVMNLPLRYTGGGFAEDAGTVTHLIFGAGATNYITASSSPCWSGNVVNSPHFLFFNLTCVDDATTGPDGRPADQVTKAVAAGSFYRVLPAGTMVPTTTPSSTAVGRHPTATGYVGTGTDCGAPPAACDCTACTTTDGSTCTASVACTATTSVNTCFAHAATDNTSWTKVSALPTCATPVTNVSCSYFPGRTANDAGATGYITDVMCQDTPPSAYIQTSGISGGSTTLIGSISNIVDSVPGLGTWNVIGGMRQNNPTPFTAAQFGVGPAISNYGYMEYTPTGSDPFDATSFRACALLVPSAADIAVTSILFHDGISQGNTGYQLVINETGNMAFHAQAASVTQAQALVANAPNVICFGNQGNTGYLKQNLGTTASAAQTITIDPTRPARLMIHFDLLWPMTGSLVEYIFTTDTSGTFDDWATAQVRRQFGLLGPKGEAVSLTRTTTRTCDVNGLTWSVPAGLPCVNTNGMLIERATTNYALNSGTHPKTTEASAALGTGAFVAWHAGTGTMTLAAGTATVTGLSCTAVSPGTLCPFTVTVGGTMLITTSAGTVTQVQIEPGYTRTSYVPTAGSAVARNADAVTVPAPTLTNPSNVCFGLTATPYGGRAWGGVAGAPAYIPRWLQYGSFAGAANSFEIYERNAGAYTLIGDTTDASLATRAASWTVSGWSAGSPHLLNLSLSGATTVLKGDGAVLAAPGTGAGVGLTALGSPILLGNSSADGYLRDFRVYRSPVCR